jgi:hypothetical protein
MPITDLKNSDEGHSVENLPSTLGLISLIPISNLNKFLEILEPAALLNAVRNQIEYYFSRENLRSDTFLLSQMDSQQSVPLQTVMRVS